MAELKTTVVVDFGEGVDSSGLLIVELDPTLNLDDSGEPKTSFEAGDEVYIAVHKLDSRAKVTSILSTSGGIFLTQTNAVEKRAEESIFLYEGSNTQLQYKPYSVPVFTWFGGVTPGITIDNRTVTSDYLPVIGNAEYNILVDIYRFIPPSNMTFLGDQFLVGLVITGELS